MTAELGIGMFVYNMIAIFGIILLYNKKHPYN